MIVCAPKCEGSKISLWFSNVQVVIIIYTVALQNHHVQFVTTPSLAKPHMHQGFCTLVLSLLLFLSMLSYHAIGNVGLHHTFNVCAKFHDYFHTK